MNGNRRTGLALVIPLAILLAVLFSGGRGAERVGAASNTNYEDLETFTNVLAIIQKNYVEEVDTKRLIEGAINGMLTSLDPHSAYLTPELYKDLQVETKGSFGGLGGRPFGDRRRRDGMALIVHDSVTMSQHSTHIGRDALERAENALPDISVGED